MVTAQTTTSGPNGLLRPGEPAPRSLSRRAHETLTMGTEKRHHGRRLARNVDTGTVAAMMATRRVPIRATALRLRAPPPLQSNAAPRYSASWSRAHP